jgi:hypothetical protein
MFKCCALSFDDLNLYLKHLELHKSNTNIQVKCNVCGHNSKTWDSFKRHYTTYHKQSRITTSLFTELPNNDYLESNTVDTSILLDDDELVTDPIIEKILNQSKFYKKYCFFDCIILLPSLKIKTKKKLKTISLHCASCMELIF